MKVNLDLTAAAVANSIIDEIQTGVGSAAFNLNHDFFYGGAEMEIWTAAGGTGTKLIEDTDYTLGGIDANLTDRAGRNVYTTVTVTNATYQTGDLYFTYQAAADYVDAVDRYRVERAVGQYYDLTSTGTFEVATTDTGASSMELNSAGGINVAAAGSLTLNDQYLTSAIPLSQTGTAGLSGLTATSIIGALNEIAAHSLDSVYENGSTITVDTTDVDWQLGAARVFKVSDSTDINKFVVRQGTAANSIQINTGGGVDVDALTGITIRDTYNGIATGDGVSLETDNTSTGTGGSIILQTIATAGSAGSITMSTDSVTRVSISNIGDTIFYGTASTTGALPVITMDQADLDEPFFKVIGDAAAATLTNNIVAAGDTGVGTAVAGYLKIEVQDDGNQVTDGDYYIPFYTLA